jgi:hypothetical protein
MKAAGQKDKTIRRREKTDVLRVSRTSKNERYTFEYFEM